MPYKDIRCAHWVKEISCKINIKCAHWLKELVVKWGFYKIPLGFPPKMNSEVY